MALPGLRVGPLDPDRTAEFGQVSGRTSARQLIRHHLALTPPQLLAALGKVRQDARSKVLDRAEVQEAAIAAIEDAGDTVPEGFKITGEAVRGADDAPDDQVVTYTYAVESGRTGKGFIPTPREALPRSFDAGDAAVAVEKARDSGLPHLPASLVEALVHGRTPVGDEEPATVLDPEADNLRAENAELREQLDRLEARIAEVEGQERTEEQRRRDAEADEGDESDDEREESEEEGGRPPAAAGEPPVEPWEGYDGANADVVVRRLREASDDERVALAEAVLSYEQANAGRGGVVKAANAILDRQPAT